MGMTVSRLRRSTLLVALIALVATSFAIVGARDAGAFPGANGKIAYATGGGVATMNPDGSGAVVLAGQAQDPAWSADGQMVAFTDTSSSDFLIYTIGADGSGRTQVTTVGDDFDPTFSPDGDWIAFRRRVVYPDALTQTTNNAAPSATVITETDVVTTPVLVGMIAENVTTGNSAVVTAVGATTITTTAITGNWNAADSYRIYNEQDRIFKIRTNGTGEVQLSSGGATAIYGDYAPEWSPDGTKIAFATKRNGNDDVYVMDAGGEAVSSVNLTADEGDVAWDPSYSPDGTKIAYASANNDAGGSTAENIWTMNADGSGKTIITAVATSKDEHPSWSPDGTLIVFEREVVTPGAQSIWTVPAGGGAATQIATSTPAKAEPHWQPTLAGVADAYGVTEGQALIVAAGTGVLANDAVLATPVGAVTAVKDSDPANGSLTLNADGSFTYTHDGSETTTDSFTYHPVQGGVAGQIATVTITITPDNDAPVAVDDGPYYVLPGEELTLVAPGVLANDTDAEGGGLTAEKVSDPTNGTVTLNADGSFTYTHDGSDTESDSFTYRAKDGGGLTSNVATVSITIGEAPVEEHFTGLVDPTQGIWYLYDDSGAIVTSFFFGNPGDYPFMGDWDGDGVETPGLYRQSDGFVYLRNTNTAGPADIQFFFGNPGDVPIAGDFNGNGSDTVSIYRPSNQTFYIINELGENNGGLGAADFSYVFGNPGDKPFVGDFDGDGVETVGLHRESTGLVYFRNSHSQGNADAQFIYGDPDDRLIAGDWNGDGSYSPALFRPSNTTMYFRYTNTAGNADNQFVPAGSQSSWLPVSGTR